MLLPSAFNTTILPMLLSRADTAATEPPRESPYSYVPTLGICILFIILFSISTLVHLIQACAYRMWFIFPTIILAGLLEILGWSGRLWSAKNVLSGDAFMIQITSTIIGPTPLLGAVFVIFGRLTRRMGTSYGVLKPRLYTIIFLSCDLIALVAQGTGGGIASGDNIPRSQLNLGSNIMLAGIVFQLVAIVVFTILAGDFLMRYRNDRPVKRAADAQSTPRGSVDWKLKSLILCLSLCTVCLLIRAVYRTIELADGWDGEIMATQWLFNLFDGAMVVLAMYTLNLGHPGVLLKAPSKQLPNDSSIYLDKMSQPSHTHV